MFQSSLKIPAIRILLEYFVPIAFSKEEQLLTYDKDVYVFKLCQLERLQNGSFLDNDKTIDFSIKCSSRKVGLSMTNSPQTDV